MIGNVDEGQRLPVSELELSDSGSIARFLAERFVNGQSAVLLRYGDTGGRIVARPRLDSPDFTYLKRFLGADISPGQIEWLADRIEASAFAADVIGLRSDLLGPNLPSDFMSTPDGEIGAALMSLYPIRLFERTRLRPDDFRRLAQTRKAMEELRLPRQALLTDAWIHVGLAEIGFLSALLRHAPGISVCTSNKSQAVMEELATSLPGRLRMFDCPAHPQEEKKWGGNHAFLWERWLALSAAIKPAYPGEPLLISAGIWTKVLAPIWAGHGGIAIDMGSVMDYFALNASRPAVLATRYGDSSTVPADLSIKAQLARTERIEDFLINQAFVSEGKP